MTGPTGRGARLHRLGPLLVIAFAVLVADLTTKAAVAGSLLDGQRAPVLALGAAVTLTLDRTPAGALSAAAVVSVVAAVAVVVAVVGMVRADPRYGSPGVGVAAGVALGGVLGDLVDRVAHGSVLTFLSVTGSPTINLAQVAAVLGGLALLLLAVRGAPPEEDEDEPAVVADDHDEASPDELDPDDEKVALVHRPKYPALRWDPMPGTPRYLSSRPVEEDQGDPHDPDDLVDPDDRLDGRTRHPAAKWERTAVDRGHGDPS